jgi:hypothetical protein
MPTTAMNNGLTQEPSEVLVELLMTRIPPGFTRTKFLVVEGPSDRQVFERFVQKPWVVRAIGDEELQREVDVDFGAIEGNSGARRRVIAFARHARDRTLENITHAVVDRDFEATEPPAGENLSCTDKRDLETTIASTDAFALFFKEVNIENCTARFGFNSPSELREKLFNLSAQIGKIRSLKNTEHWDLDFKKIDYFESICFRRLKVKIFKVWRCIATQRVNYPSLKDLKALLRRFKHEDVEISQGHDLCGFAAALLKICRQKKTGDCSPWNRNEIEALLRGVFQKEHLLKTRLGEHLLERKVI